MLGFFLLALHYDAAGKMGDAHGTAGFVDMLTAGATGPVHVDSQVFVFNVNHNFLVELGINEYGRKRSMAFSAGVERRNPDQAVNPWWSGLQGQIGRFDNLEVLRIPPQQSDALAALAERGMHLNCTIQDGQVWISGEHGEVTVELEKWLP